MGVRQRAEFLCRRLRKDVIRDFVWRKEGKFQKTQNG